MKTLAVVGGGIGGIIVANRVQRRLGRAARIIVFEPNERHLFAPSLLRVLAGDRRPDEIAKPLRRMLDRRVEIVNAGVDCIDASTLIVESGSSRTRADAIAVAVGADLASGAIPGLHESGFNLYDLDDVLALRDALQTATGRILLVTTRVGYKCPAAPYEAALLVHRLLKHRHGADVRVDMVAAEPAPMAVAGPAMSAAVLGMLNASGIGYAPNRSVTAVDRERRVVQFADGAEEPFDLLVYVPPHVPPAMIARSHLAGASGWVEVDRASMTTAFDGVYALGDATHIPLRIGNPLPRAGVFAHAQARVVADRIVARFSGALATASFNGHGACLFETDRGRAAEGTGNFYAEPSPRVKLSRPSRFTFLKKDLLEKAWLGGLMSRIFA